MTEQSGHGYQDLITRGMAMHVIHLFEVIDIELNNGKVSTIAGRQQDLFTLFVEAATILQASERDGGVDAEDAAVLSTAVAAIVAGYSRGTRFGIRVDDDGLVAAGVPGVQLTWMDAKVGDWVVTPRIGKPVEIQALWINALRIAARWDVSLHATADKAAASFEARFWNEAAGCLFDVVDADGVSGAVDASVRPNQLLAVGGLPWAVLTGARARRVVDVAESRLWTPAGLRSLAADDAAYVGVYKGDMRERDGAYHQGTVWPWLVGAFVDAWVRVHGGTETARRDAGGRFLDPLLAHYQQSAPGHVGEIADGAAPHTPQGCPFQAWSVGEALWVQEVVLRTDAEQQPEAVADVDFTTFAKQPRVMDFNDYEIRVEEVFRFNPEDTLVFHLLLKNKADAPIHYRPDSFSLRVGNRLYPQSISDAAGLIPPKSEVTAYFAVTGTPDGERNELSLKNDFTVLVDRLPTSPTTSATNQPPCTP